MPHPSARSTLFIRQKRHHCGLPTRQDPGCLPTLSQPPKLLQPHSQLGSTKPPHNSSFKILSDPLHTLDQKVQCPTPCHLSKHRDPSREDPKNPGGNPRPLLHVHPPRQVNSHQVQPTPPLEDIVQYPAFSQCPPSHLPRRRIPAPPTQSLPLPTMLRLLQGP